MGHAGYYKAQEQRHHLHSFRWGRRLLNIQHNYSTTQNNGKTTSESDLLILGSSLPTLTDALNRLASAQNHANRRNSVGAELYFTLLMDSMWKVHPAEQSLEPRLGPDEVELGSRIQVGEEPTPLLVGFFQGVERLGLIP